MVFRALVFRVASFELIVLLESRRALRIYLHRPPPFTSPAAVSSLTKLAKSVNSFSTSPWPTQFAKQSASFPVDVFTSSTSSAKADMHPVIHGPTA